MHASASARRASFAMSAVPFSFVWMPSGVKCLTAVFASAESVERTSRRRHVDDANFISAQVGAAGEDAALLYDAVATAELDAARTPPSTDDDADALALMALSRS